jgi:hypothetical protein
MLNVFSYAAHLSNSLNATYFPVKGKDGFTDAAYTETMGTLLNFYKGATTDSLKNFVDGEQQQIKGNTLIEPIKLIKMNDYIPILELEEVLTKEIIQIVKDCLRRWLVLILKNKSKKLNCITPRFRSF